MTPLRFAQLETTEVWNRPEGWKIKSTPSPVWWRRKLADLCWKVLFKLDALEQFSYSVKSYTYGKKEQDKLTKHVLENINEVIMSVESQYELINNYCIVIGEEDYMELMGTYESFRYNINVPSGEFFVGRGGYRTVFCGVPIHVVPYASGIAAIPKVIVEKRK